MMVNLTLGDIILSCNGKLITRIYDLNFFNDSEKAVNLRILRKGSEMDVVVPTVSGEEGETDRFVLWAGALLHAPHRAVRQQAKTLHSLVYISGILHFTEFRLTCSSKSWVASVPVWIDEHDVYNSSQWKADTRSFLV